MKRFAVLMTAFLLMLLCACERVTPPTTDTLPTLPPQGTSPVESSTAHSAAPESVPPVSVTPLQPVVTPVSQTAVSGLSEALHDCGFVPEPALPNGTYESLLTLSDLLTSAPIVCDYSDGQDEGVGTLPLSPAYPGPAFSMEIHTSAGTVRLSRSEWRDNAEPETNGLTIALDDTICTVCPEDLLSVSVAMLDGEREYLLLQNADAEGDPSIILFRLTGGLENLGTLPDRDLRGDGVSLLSGERLSCFSEDTLLTWYTLEGGTLHAHCADPDTLTERVYTAKFDVYGQLPQETDIYGQSDEWIPEGEQIIIDQFPGNWYNDWMIRRADGRIQHYVLWIGE